MGPEWNASPIAMGSMGFRCSRSTGRNLCGHRTGTARLCTRRMCLLRIGCRRSHAVFSLLSLHFLCRHRLINPLVCCPQVMSALGGIVTLKIGLLSIHQIYVGHRIVVVRAKFDGLAQALDSFFHRRHVLGSQIVADFPLFWALPIQALVRLHDPVSPALPCVADSTSSSR